MVWMCANIFIVNYSICVEQCGILIYRSEMALECPNYSHFETLNCKARKLISEGLSA